MVYVQPYTKSLVGELFSDSVAIDDPSPGSKVQFDTLKGVTPNGFRIAFRKTQKRKDADGKAITWHTTDAKPTFLSTFAYYQPLEAKAVMDFEQAVARVEAIHPHQNEMNLEGADSPKKRSSATRKGARARK